MRPSRTLRAVRLETWERAQRMGTSALPCHTRKRRKVPPPLNGTDLAIYNSSKSARPLSSKLTGARHGGARNRADRTSSSLSEKQAQAIYAAVGKAAALGLPPNRHWTVHWTRLGVADEMACRATGALLTLVRDWLRKQGHRFACIWVRENDNGDGSKGSHAHILLHVPPGVRWCGWRNRRWLERVSGRPYVSRATCTRLIAGHKSAGTASPSLFSLNLAVVTAYIAKGGPAGPFGLAAGPSGLGGVIQGKRWGRSKCLAPSCAE